MTKKRVRDYKKEYRDYQGRPDQIEERSSRNKARRKLEKEGKVHKGDGMEVDHINSDERDNSRKNLRVTTRRFNRKRARHET